MALFMVFRKSFARICRAKKQPPVTPITKALPSSRIVEGETFGAVGKGLTLEALRRNGPGN